MQFAIIAALVTLAQASIVSPEGYYVNEHGFYKVYATIQRFATAWRLQNERRSTATGPLPCVKMSSNLQAPVADLFKCSGQLYPKLVECDGIVDYVGSWNQLKKRWEMRDENPLNPELPSLELPPDELDKDDEMCFEFTPHESGNWLYLPYLPGKCTYMDLPKSGAIKYVATTMMSGCSYFLLRSLKDKDHYRVAHCNTFQQTPNPRYQVLLHVFDEDDEDSLNKKRSNAVWKACMVLDRLAQDFPKENWEIVESLHSMDYIIPALPYARKAKKGGWTLHTYNARKVNLLGSGKKRSGPLIQPNSVDIDDKGLDSWRDGPPEELDVLFKAIEKRPREQRTAIESNDRIIEVFCPHLNCYTNNDNCA